MPLLNFQSRFAPLVESGEKRQTIRKRRKDGRDPKVGDRLHLWTGCRTPNSRKLGEAICTYVQSISISVDGRFRIGTQYGDTVRMSPRMVSLLAEMDGFETTYEMLNWFRDTHGLPFDGFVIRWDELEK